MTNSLLGTNLYAYCENNPVNGYDPSGYWAMAIPYIEQGTQSVTSLNWSAVWQNIGYGATVAWNALTSVVTSNLGGATASISKVTSSSQPVGDSFSYIGGGTATPPPPQAPKNSGNSSKKTTPSSTSKPSADQLKYSNSVTSHIIERPYMNSSQLINEIMESRPMQDKILTNGLKWVTNGSFNGSVGTWELVIDMNTNTIVHYLFKGGV